MIIAEIGICTYYIEVSIDLIYANNALKGTFLLHVYCVFNLTRFSNANMQCHHFSKCMRITKSIFCDSTSNGDVSNLVAKLLLTATNMIALSGSINAKTGVFVVIVAIVQILAFLYLRKGEETISIHTTQYKHFYVLVGDCDVCMYVCVLW